jgi:hypothetical protein
MHWPDISRQPSQLTQLSDVGWFVIPPGSGSINVIMLPDANSVISSPFYDDPSTATPECNDHDGGWLHEHMRNCELFMYIPEQYELTLHPHTPGFYDLNVTKKEYMLHMLQLLEGAELSSLYMLFLFSI